MSPSSFVDTHLRVSFSIPKDAYDLIKKIENDFDKFHKKVQHRKGIHHIFSTHRNDYLNNMYNLYMCYCELFNFFAVNSSQEKSISKKLNEIQNIISKYSVKYKKDVKYPDHINIVALIWKYRTIFTNLYGDSMKQGIVIMNSSLNILLNYSIDRSRLTLKKGNGKVNDLRPDVMGPNTPGYGEIKSNSEKIDDALKQVRGLHTVIEETFKSFRIDLIKKHDSASAVNIEDKYHEILASITVFEGLISRCQIAMQNKIGESIKKSNDDNRKTTFELWRGLTFACNILENDMQKLISELRRGVSDVESLRILLVSLRNSSIHLAGLLDKKIKPSEDTVFNYSKLESGLLSKLDKMCKKTKDISKEVTKLKIHENQTVRKIQYNTSYKRKMEKFCSILKGLSTFFSSTSISITNTMRAVDSISDN